MLFCTQELEVGPSATSSVQPLWANSPYRNGYLRFIYLDILEVFEGQTSSPCVLSELADFTTV